MSQIMPQNARVGKIRRAASAAARANGRVNDIGFAVTARPDEERGQPGRGLGHCPVHVGICAARSPDPWRTKFRRGQRHLHQPGAPALARPPSFSIGTDVAASRNGHGRVEGRRPTGSTDSRTRAGRGGSVRFTSAGRLDLMGLNRSFAETSDQGLNGHGGSYRGVLGQQRRRDGCSSAAGRGEMGMGLMSRRATAAGGNRARRTSVATWASRPEALVWSRISTV